ncbi:MAG: MmcQ/YjbR family DNA-binding protein [Pseudomonadota bacterium]
MFAALVDQHCRALPGAASERPFGPDTQVWTVGGRMFAAYTFDGGGLSLACASAQAAQRMVQEGRAISAPYLKQPGWVMFPWDRSTPNELRGRISESYTRVRQGLPPEISRELPPLEVSGLH